MWRLLICREFRSHMFYLESFCELCDPNGDPCTEPWHSRRFMCIVEGIKLSPIKGLLSAPGEKRETVSQALCRHLVVIICTWHSTPQIWLRKCNSLLQVGENREEVWEEREQQMFSKRRIGFHLWEPRLCGYTDAQAGPSVAFSLLTNAHLWAAARLRK